MLLKNCLRQNISSSKVFCHQACPWHLILRLSLFPSLFFGLDHASMQDPVQRRDWGKGRGEGSGAKDMPDGRILLMMIYFVSNNFSKACQGQSLPKPELK